MQSLLVTSKTTWQGIVNSLAPGKLDLKVIFKLIFVIDG